MADTLTLQRVEPAQLDELAGLYAVCGYIHRKRPAFTALTRRVLVCRAR